jgi:murein DD-endopeptidase
MLSVTRARLSAVAVVSCLSIASILLAEQRPALIESVDLLIPVSPVVVQIAGKATLVYELHVTNFNAIDIAVSRVQVLGGDRSARSIADYRGDDVRKRIGRPGLRRVHENPHVIGPGLRGVVYLWIEVPDDIRMPAGLRHRLEIDVQRPTGVLKNLVEGAAFETSREQSVVLGPPLRGGPWVAIYDPLLMGGHRTATYTVNGRARIPGRFAIDWIRLPPSGALEKGAGHSDDWNGYGAEVLAVADATVAAAMDDIPENVDPPVADGRPITPENASGNYVALDLGRGRFAFYEHLEHGTITVKAGDRVKAGQVIGQLGYSGSSSIGPHLHFHVSNAKSTLGAEGLPFVFTRFEHHGAFESIDALIRGDTWRANPDGRPSVREMEYPGANWVVWFR